MKQAGKSGGKLSVALFVIFLAIALVSGGLFACQQFQLWNAARDAEQNGIPSTGTGNRQLVDNPINFSELQAENPDIYAWLYVPNTQVNYPVFQHADDDGFYLKHNKDGVESIEGAIYTERANSKDFTDPVTVIYGHNIRGGLMFGTLHEFEDKAFFDENPEFFIYTPGHILTYEIVAAEGTDDRHILNTRKLEDEAELLAYFNEIMHPGTVQANVREGVELNADSKIVQLSTCNYEHGNERYVVTGLLVNDQPTW